MCTCIHIYIYTRPQTGPAPELGARIATSGSGLRKGPTSAEKGCAGTWTATQVKQSKQGCLTPV